MNHCGAINQASIISWDLMIILKTNNHNFDIYDIEMRNYSSLEKKNYSYSSFTSFL